MTLFVSNNSETYGHSILKYNCCLKFCKIHKKIPTMASIFSKVANFYKKFTSLQVFSCEFCKIVKRKAGYKFRKRCLQSFL